jgi:hydroxymethylbilane synthase
MKTNKIIIGTRGSILALAQAEKVKEMLIEKYDELRQRDDFQGIEDFDKNSPLDIELKVIVTSGDKDLRDFTKIRGITQKDLFVKEIEKEMIENKIDLAVHSLKDMPQNTPAGLLNACFPLREDNRDVLVSAKGLKLDELPENAVVGTGSIRREKELLSLRKDLKIKAIRGNIHTRLKKLDDGEYDAIILAAAGLKRVGLQDRITEYFDTASFMPAPGQGILCIQCRENDRKIKNLLKIINDREVTLICEAEREFSRIFDGGCHTPIGCSSVIEGDILKLKGMYNDNGNRIFKEVSGNKENPKEIAQKLAKEIRNE